MKKLTDSTFRRIVLLVGLLALAISPNLNAQGSSNYCPLTPGYWKNHPNDWPLGSMTLGDQTYTRVEALALLDMSTTGDASITLANQLIAVILNIAIGSDPNPIAGQVSQSHTLLSGYGIRLPYNVSPSTTEGGLMVNTADQLDTYNRGRMTPHCFPPPTPLPVQLASFSGSIINSTAVLLRWITLSELNNFGFYVERRRLEEPAFSLLSNSFVPGNGTTVEPQYYNFTDDQAGVGSRYYRLKQIDLDATIHYTDAILVDIVTSVPAEAPYVYALEQNYPNPFNPTTKISFQLPAAEIVSLRVIDLLGREVLTLVNGELHERGNHDIRFNAGGLGSGVYFYELKAGSFQSTKKMLLVK